MPIRIELTDDNNFTETEVVANGCIPSFYDFTKAEELEVIVATVAQLQYYGQLAIYRYQPSEVVVNPFYGGNFSRVMSNPLPRAMVEDNLVALLQEGESFEEIITSSEGKPLTLELSVQDEH